MKTIILIVLVIFTSAITPSCDSDPSTPEETVVRSGWQKKPSGTTWDLMSVHFSDALNGTAVGQASTVLHTSDGGETWKAQTGPGWFNGVYFVDRNTGWVAGEYGVIVHTSDSGVNWGSQDTEGIAELMGVSFSNEKVGIVVFPAGIYRTTTGGDTWVLQDINEEEREFLVSVDFADSLTVIVVGGGPGSEGAGVSVVHRSTDAGKTWVSQKTGTRPFLRDVCFLDALTGTVVGDVGTILRTEDGGETWIDQSKGLTNFFWGVSFFDADAGCVAGRDGVVFWTTDGGDNWIKQNSGTDESLWGVFMLGRKIAVAVGTGGIILRTVDGGGT